SKFGFIFRLGLRNRIALFFRSEFFEPFEQIFWSYIKSQHRQSEPGKQQQGAGSECSQSTGQPKIEVKSERSRKGGVTFRKEEGHRHRNNQKQYNEVRNGFADGKHPNIE